METKERILKEAFLLFGKHGYRGVSINQIVEKVGITKGGFYHYFSSKEELFIGGIEQFIFQNMKELTDSLFDTSENVYQFLREYFLFPIHFFQWIESIGLKDIKGMYVLMFNGLDMFPSLFDRMLETYRSQIGMIRDLLRRGKGNGEIGEEVDEYATALQIISTLEGLFFVAMALKHGEMDSLERYLLSMFDNLWKGLERREEE